MPRFEWDERKRLTNIRRHGLDFLDATQLFDGRPVFTYRSTRGDQERWGTVGRLSITGLAKLYLAVWTRRDGKIRIISFYRADLWEERAYRELHG